MSRSEAAEKKFQAGEIDAKKSAVEPGNQNDRRPQCIYFMQCNGADGPIKIGRASNPRRRLGEIRIGCPYPIELLAEFSAENAEEVELELHYKFTTSRMHGEWFQCTPELLEVVAAHRAAMPAWRVEAMRSVPKGKPRSYYDRERRTA